MLITEQVTIAHHHESASTTVTLSQRNEEGGKVTRGIFSEHLARGQKWSKMLTFEDGVRRWITVSAALEGGQG